MFIDKVENGLKLLNGWLRCKKTGNFLESGHKKAQITMLNTSETESSLWGHTLIHYGGVWILGFNGLLAKEAADNARSLMVMGSPIRDHHHKARILKGAFSGCCSTPHNQK